MFSTYYITRLASRISGKIHTPEVFVANDDPINVTVVDPVVILSNVAPKNPLLIRYLDENGDGTGNKIGNGDYSGAPTEFFISPPLGESYNLTRLIIYIEDTTGMDNAKYGNTGPLLNGVGISVTVGGIVTDLLDGLPIKTNGQWKRLCYDQHIDSTGAGNDSCAARWILTSSDTSIALDHGDKFSITLNDDLSGLIDHTFLLEGYLA
jgi:hypothetical protein